MRTIMRAWWSKARAIFTRRRSLAQDLSEEIDAHLELEIQENLARGIPAEETRRRFGNKRLIQERAHEIWTFPVIEGIAKDLGYAYRMLRKNPVFAATAVLTLALGIGGNTLMFSVIRAVLLKPLTYRNPDRLVRISVDIPQRNQQDIGFTLLRYEEMKNSARSFSDLAAFFIGTERMTLSGGGEPEVLKGSRMSANFLDVLGVKPLLGRGFLPAEDRSRGPNVAMISASLWTRRFSADPRIAGKTVSLNATPYTIVGVLPPGFSFPYPGMDVWVTRPAEFSALPPQVWPVTNILVGIAHLKPLATIDQARSELNVLNRSYIAAHRGPGDAAESATMRVAWIKDQLVANVRLTLWTLFGAVGFVLLIACSNFASLLLARATSRSREFGVRTALGAARSRLIRQVLAESVLVSLIGGVLGGLLAWWAVSFITRLNIVNLPRVAEIHLDGIVLGFALALSFAAGVLVGILPALGASRPDVADILRTHGEVAHTGPGRWGKRLNTRGMLVITQAALSVMLLVGAALLMESFARLHSVNPGFQPANLLTMHISLPPSRYDARGETAFFQQLIQRVEGLPGVRGAGVVQTLPTLGVYAMPVAILGQPPQRPEQRPVAQRQSITPDFFRTMGIGLRRGREFTRQDVPGSAPVPVIVNESFARRFWPDYPSGADPVGQRLFSPNPSTAPEIVGIVADVHEHGFAKDATPEVYFPLADSPVQSADFVVRTTGDPMRAANLIRSQVLAIDPNQAVSDVRTMDEIFDASVGQQRLTLTLIAAFAGVALLLALIGLYGVVAYSVTQRTQEIGIRQALGAQKKDILRLVIGQGLGLALIGVALGIGAALALTRVMKSLLFHVSATDPATFAGVAILFLTVAFVASYIPARRAARVDPMTALK